AYVATSETATVPQLAIRPVHERTFRETVAYSAAWIGLTVVAALAALIPGLGTRLRPLLPEVVLSLGLLVWYWTGLTPVVCALVSLGFVGIRAGLAPAARRLMQPRPQPVQPPGSSVVPVSGS